MKFYYKNHKGEIINLSNYPYVFQEGDILNWNYTYDNDGTKTNNYINGPKEYKIKVAVAADKNLSYEEREEVWKQSVDNLVETASVDVANDKTGAIYTDTGYYLPCKISGFEKTSYSRQGNVISGQFTVVADSQEWITEISKSFIPGTDVSINALDYPHDYPYDYAPKVSTGSIMNDNYMAADFRLTIFGPAVNPAVTIGENVYKVYTELTEDEYLVIDSQTRTVTQYDALGNQERKYNSRDKNYEIYAQIPVGSQAVSWDGGFGFDLTLYQKRSEPRWSL